MKIIDLLNKIANGEEVPKKIKYKNQIYKWKEYDCGYQKKKKIDWIKKYGYVAELNRTYFYLEHCYQDLNDTVEILEEEKKIPERLYLSDYEDTTGKFDYDVLLTINEIIDYLKSKGDE